MMVSPSMEAASALARLWNCPAAPTVSTWPDAVTAPAAPQFSSDVPMVVSGAGGPTGMGTMTGAMVDRSSVGRVAGMVLPDWVTGPPSVMWVGWTFQIWLLARVTGALAMSAIRYPLGLSLTMVLPVMVNAEPA